MNYKQKLGYTILGAGIMLIGLGLGAIISPPLIAQRADVPDEITCSGLRVNDKNGNLIAYLGSPDGTAKGLYFFDPLGKPEAAINIDKVSNTLLLTSPIRKTSIILGHSNDQNKLIVHDENGAPAISAIVGHNSVKAIMLANPTEEAENGIVISALPQIKDNAIIVYNAAGKRAVELNSNPTLGNRIRTYDMMGNFKWIAP